MVAFLNSKSHSKVKKYFLGETASHYKTLFSKLKLRFSGKSTMWYVIKLSQWGSIMKNATSHFCNDGIYSAIVYASNKTLQGMVLY